MTYIWFLGEETAADRQRDHLDTQHRRWVETNAALFHLRFGMSLEQGRWLAFRQINAGRDILDLPPLEWPP